VSIPGQTIGPFYGFALPYAGGPDLVPPTHPGAVQLTGRVLDGNGDPVPDALLEIWQPDSAGNPVQEPGSLHRDGFTFAGWGRCPTDNTGRYRFTTLRPGGASPVHRGDRLRPRPEQPALHARLPVRLPGRPTPRFRA
jgi:protocatechuate 3,4-dioxygenase alpha subunit